METIHLCDGERRGNELKCMNVVNLPFSSCSIGHPSHVESIVKVDYCSSLYGITVSVRVLATPNPV